MACRSCNAEGSVTSNRWKAISIAVTLSLTGVTLHAQDEMQYQRRSNRYEGIKQKPVSGFDIELLSARVDFNDSPRQLSERLHVRFFLEQPAPVHIVVRELDYKYFYWLDRVVPQSPWRTGYGNVFDWPTSDVVRQLDGLSISDLGVVARLEREGPSAVEQVAPVVFYQTQFPAKVTGYIFHFRLREDAKVKGAIYKMSAVDAVFAQDLGKQRGNRPFAFKWDLTSSPASEGMYKLVITGYLLATNDPVSQVVQFYHKADIK
jgi:hypothetical protein